MKRWRMPRRRQVWQKARGAVTGAVVGEEASDAYAERAIVGHGGVEELHGRAAALIGQDLGEGDAGMVVDGDVDELQPAARERRVLSPVTRWPARWKRPSLLMSRWSSSPGAWCS